MAKNAGFYVQAGALDLATLTDTDIATDPNWVEACVRSVERSSSKEQIEATDRCSGDFKAFVPGRQEGGVTFTANKKRNQLWYPVVRDAFQNDSEITLLMLDGKRTVTGAEGLVAICNVFDFSESQADGIIEITFELRVSGCTSVIPPAKEFTVPTLP